jgi:hypothetical protein
MTLWFYLLNDVLGTPSTFTDVESLLEVPNAVHAEEMHNNPFYVMDQQAQ